LRPPPPAPNPRQPTLIIGLSNHRRFVGSSTIVIPVAKLILPAQLSSLNHSTSLISRWQVYMFPSHYLPTRSTPMKPLSYHNLNSTKRRTLSTSARRLNPVGNTVSPSSRKGVEVADDSGAILIPINPQHRILKIPWNRQTMQMGRGPQGPTGNDVVIQEKRVSNRHCKISLGLQGQGSSIGDGEPDVWIEDMKSSNGTFVSFLCRPFME
jgi:hypothetical protein